LFEEKPYGLIAYIKSSEYSQNIFEKVKILNSKEFEVEFEVKKIENKNWNEEWEKNYAPVEINEYCTVRAPFHKSSKKTYDIIIKPEMSFGTGHHETTQLMIDFLFEQNLVNKKICDVGCGTGILSIIAEKTGAIEVDAVDIALNCIENTIDNINRNNCKKINTKLCSSEGLLGKTYDFILSNITLNNLKDNFKNFENIAKQNTILIISGFYNKDLKNINQMLKDYGFELIEFKTKNRWVASKYCCN
jgi:ribosomal protein L11 methyltransferase